MNSGKIFEKAIENSIPDYCLYHRLPDPPQSFNKSDALRFSRKNPCDCFVFNGQTAILYALELKTTKNNTFTFEDINEEKPKPKMIHKHQILALIDFSKYQHVCAGFIFNFRKPDGETTYFQRIDNFVQMTNAINKKSFTEADLLKFNPVTINGRKKRVNYTWDLDTFFNAAYTNNTMMEE